MNRSTYTDYFLKPEQATQRRYEALRAVFVDEESMQDVAQRFGLTYGTIRNWVSEFRRSCDDGVVPPPFSLEESFAEQPDGVMILFIARTDVRRQ